MPPFPPLRNIDASPMEHEGEMVFCLNDTMGYVEEDLALSPAAFFVAASLDGERGVKEIQDRFRAQFGGLTIPGEQVEQIVSFLDEHGFLLSERFAALREQVEGAFRRAETREAHLAGAGYPSDPAALRAFLDGFFTHEKGPGPRTAPGGSDAPPLRGLVAPHIDFHRGGPCYAHAYAEMLRHGKPDTVFVFGVAHAGAPVPYILTRKHFETPLGAVECDRAAVDEIALACDWDPFEWEWVHRNEHSIEFQAVMLAHLFGTEVKIVPVLASMLGGEDAEAHPGQQGEVQRFLDACHAAASDPSRRVTVIAGADLAHVGKRFGDAFDIDAGVVARVAERDEEDLAHVLQGNAPGWFTSVMRDGNERKVCGLGCIYSAMAAMGAAPGAMGGKVLQYDYAHDPAGGIVSFAAVALPGRSAQ